MVVLSAAALDLYRSHQGCQLAGTGDVPSPRQCVNQPSAKGIAATRRIDHRTYFNARNIKSLTGEAVTQFCVERDSDPYTKSIEFPVTAGAQWKQIQIPFVAAESYDAGRAGINFRLGFPPETFEIALMADGVSEFSRD